MSGTPLAKRGILNNQLGVAMARIDGTARARCQYIGLLACVVGMLFCWANAALHLHEPVAVLMEAAAYAGAVLAAATAAYADTPELVVEPYH